MSIPVYTAGIPQPTDTLSSSQPQMLNNFTAIQGLVDVNHVDFSDSTYYGQHQLVQLPYTQSVAPSTTQGMAVYTMTGITSAPALFVQKQGAATGINITDALFSAQKGYTYLPSGVIMQWGYARTNNTASPSAVTITLIKSYSDTNYSIQLTGWSTSWSGSTNYIFTAITGSQTTNTFQVVATTTGNASQQNANFYWMTIGV